MNKVLTRRDVQDQIELFISGKQSQSRLAQWAFDQFCDVEDENMVYEAGAEEVLHAVLDDLMWADSDPFELSAADASALLQRLATGDGHNSDRQPEVQDRSRKV